MLVPLPITISLAREQHDKLGLKWVPNLSRATPGLFLDLLDRHGGICSPPPSYEGASPGGQSVNGGTCEGGHRPYGGPNFDRLYHKLKVLLLLLILLQ